MRPVRFACLPERTIRIMALSNRSKRPWRGRPDAAKTSCSPNHPDFAVTMGQSAARGVHRCAHLHFEMSGARSHAPRPISGRSRRRLFLSNCERMKSQRRAKKPQPAPAHRFSTDPEIATLREASRSRNSNAHNSVSASAVKYPWGLAGLLSVSPRKYRRISRQYSRGLNRTVIVFSVAFACNPLISADSRK